MLLGAIAVLATRGRALRVCEAPWLRVAACALLLAAAPADAQWWFDIPGSKIPRNAAGEPDLTAPAPRLADGRPDLHPDTKSVPFQPWAKELADARADGSHSRDDPPAQCLPQGVPRLGGAPGPWKLVQTRGFNGKPWLDQVGKPSTEKLRVIERYRRKDYGHLDIEITIDDPGAYTAPWKVIEHFDLKPETDLLEFACNENNRDLQHLPSASD